MCALHQSCFVSIARTSCCASWGCQSVPDCPCDSATDFGNESCRNKNRVVLHVVAHMYNEGVVFGLAYHYYVIAPALQPISAILVQAFHKLDPECYRNGLLQHIAPLTHPFASSVVASATQFCWHSLAQTGSNLLAQLAASLSLH